MDPIHICGHNLKKKLLYYSKRCTYIHEPTLQSSIQAHVVFVSYSLIGHCDSYQSPQENILLIDTATILSALKERNALLLLQAEADANSFTHGKVTESLRKEAEAARFVLSYVFFYIRALIIRSVET